MDKLAQQLVGVVIVAVVLEEIDNRRQQVGTEVFQFDDLAGAPSIRDMLVYLADELRAVSNVVQRRSMWSSHVDCLMQGLRTASCGRIGIGSVVRSQRMVV